MKKPQLLLFICLLAASLFAGDYKKEHNASSQKNSGNSNNLQIDFKPVVGSVPLYFDSVYRNNSGEPYSVSAFKFYVGRFRLINAESGLEYPVADDKYFLVDAADSTTWFVSLAVPSFRYRGISFLIGVDSIRNVSGAQTGALDPANGMFWTWNSGYIMAKLEGHSPLSPLINNKFEYHIGGFQGNNSVLSKPVLLLPNGGFRQSDANSSTVITVTANVNDWFYSPHTLKIAKTPACTTPGALAKAISENYSKMFTITSITN